MKLTVEQLQRVLDELDDGVLKAGVHFKNSGAFCAIELDTAARGLPWSDNPGNLPDIRPINDGPWSSDEARTKALLPLMAALSDWADWTPAKQRRWIIQVVIQTVARVIANLPHLPAVVKSRCASVTTLEEAAEAARVAAWAARSAEAARAAAWAARAAADAAWAARAAAEAAWAARAAAEAAGAAARSAEAAGAAARSERNTAEAAAGTARATEIARASEAVLQTAVDSWISSIP